jgi:hypothetical protein
MNHYGVHSNKIFCNQEIKSFLRFFGWLPKFISFFHQQLLSSKLSLFNNQYRTMVNCILNNFILKRIQISCSSLKYFLDGSPNSVQIWMVGFITFDSYLWLFLWSQLPYFIRNIICHFIFLLRNFISHQYINAVQITLKYTKQLN